MKQTDINNRNEAIARFMEFEFVTIEYFGTKYESKWQVENEKWMNKVELDSVGHYWVNIKEDKFIPEHELDYHSSWESIMPVIKKVMIHDDYCNTYEALKADLSWCEIDRVFKTVSDYCLENKMM